MNNGILPRSSAADKFLAQLTRGGADAEVLHRLGRIDALQGQVPDAATLKAIWDGTGEPTSSRRRARATASVRRRSAREPGEGPKPLTAHERRYGAKLAKRQADWVRRPEATPDELHWRQIPQEVWIACKDLMSCTSGAAVKFHFARQRNKAAIGAMRRAALLPQQDGSTLRTWSSEPARRIAALAYAMLALGKHSARKGPWGPLVRGIPLSAFRALLAYSDGTRVPSWTALTGHHRGPLSRFEHGELGYLPMLRGAGFLHSQQWYPDAAPWETGRKWFRGSDGRVVKCQINRYWLVTQPPRRGPKRADLIELVREGWAALSEHPKGLRSLTAVYGKTAENRGPSIGPPD